MTQAERLEEIEACLRSLRLQLAKCTYEPTARAYRREIRELRAERAALKGQP